MRKYFIVFSNTLQKALIYRARNIVYAVINVTPILVMIAIWGKYYAEGKTVSEFTYLQLLAYYSMSIIISLWTSAVHEHVKDDIKDGELSNYVIKPFDYFGFRLSWEVGWYAIKFLMLIVPLIILLFHFQIVSQIQLNIGTALSFVFAYLISFCFSIIIGLLAFHTTETTGITNMYWMLTELLTGKVFPITFFSKSIQTILEILPFKYMVYFPVQAAIGKITGNQLSSGILIQLLWIVGLYLMGRKMWSSGIKKFSGVGI